MQIGVKAGIDQYLIAQERHKDGGYHLHAYFKFDRKLDWNSAKCFNVKYYKDYHPSIERIKHKWHMLKYIKKEGEYITNMSETRPPWLVLLEDSSTRLEFLEGLMWKINRIDNYAGYRTLTDLWQEKAQLFSGTRVPNSSDYHAQALRQSNEGVPS